MMPPKKRASRAVKKCHLKLMGVGPAWVRRCKVALKRFFIYLRHYDIIFPRSRDELDEVAAEYVNFLYQDDRPIGWAESFLGGLKRFCFKYRKDLEKASLYHRNWSRSIVRQNAHSFSCHLVLANATCQDRQ